MSLYATASAVSAAPAESKIVMAVSRAYFMTSSKRGCPASRSDGPSTKEMAQPDPTLAGAGLGYPTMMRRPRHANAYQLPATAFRLLGGHFWDIVRPCPHAAFRRLGHSKTSVLPSS